MKDRPDPASAAPAERDREAELAALFDALRAATPEHDFFAVLRRVESLRPDQPRFGEALRPAHEALRLGQDPELDFAPAALQSFDMRGGSAPRLGVRFFGLLGPQGPMPLHLTEYVRERLRFRGDATLARFLDVFHHRLLTLFYRSWAQAQPTVHQDRPGRDRFASWLGTSFGAEQAPADDRRSVPHTARLFQAGLLGVRSRHPEGMVKLLRQYFRVPVRLREHVEHRLVLDDADRTRLGFSRSRNESTFGRSSQLGVSATSGRTWLDRQYKFRLAIGPLTLAQYDDFLPGGRTWRALREWVQHYCGLDLRWDVELCLARDHVPEPRLGAGRAFAGPPARRARLGVSTWIGRAGREHDRSDLRLRPDTSFLLRHGARHA